LLRPGRLLSRLAFTSAATYQACARRVVRKSHPLAHKKLQTPMNWYRPSAWHKHYQLAGYCCCRAQSSGSCPIRYQMRCLAQLSRSRPQCAISTYCLVGGLSVPSPKPISRSPHPNAPTCPFGKCERIAPDEEALAQCVPKPCNPQPATSHSRGNECDT
jgi:hypothetical protein